MDFLNTVSPIFTIGIFIVSFLALMGVVNNIQLRPIYNRMDRLEIRMDRLEARMDSIEDKLNQILLATVQNNKQASLNKK